MLAEFYRAKEEMDFIANIQEEDKSKMIKLMEWVLKASRLSVKERTNKNLFPKRGEIWSVDLGENVESELNKNRPCVIIQDDINNKFSPLVIVLPITNKNHVQMHDFQVPLTADMFLYESNITGTIISEQIRCVSKGRLGKRLGAIKYGDIPIIEKALLQALGMSKYFKNNMNNDNFIDKVIPCEEPNISANNMLIEQDEIGSMREESNPIITNTNVETDNCPVITEECVSEKKNELIKVDAPAIIPGLTKTYPAIKNSNKKKKKKKKK